MHLIILHTIGHGFIDRGFFNRSCLAFAHGAGGRGGGGLLALVLIGAVIVFFSVAVAGSKKD